MGQPLGPFDGRQKALPAHGISITNPPDAEHDGPPPRLLVLEEICMTGVLHIVFRSMRRP